MKRQKSASFANNRSNINKLMIKNNRKVRDYCHYAGKSIAASYSICNLEYSMPKEVPVSFHNGSNIITILYHFIIKLAKEFEVEFSCLGELKIQNPISSNNKIS